MKPETKKKLQRSDDCCKAFSESRKNTFTSMAKTKGAYRLDKEWDERPDGYREKCYHGEKYIKFAGINCFMD